jgi:hypothetical protein
MSERIGNTFIVKEEELSTCEYCGTVAELRPYGKDGAHICFECGTKDLETTEKMFAKAVEGATIIVPQNIITPLN